jgi:hypothetical protein
VLVIALGPTFNLPLIPTPPDTNKAPVVGVVDAVEPVMFKPDALNVFPRALTPERTYDAVFPIDVLLLEPVR